MSHPLRTVLLSDEEAAMDQATAGTAGTTAIGARAAVARGMLALAAAPATGETAPPVPRLRVIQGGRDPAVLRRRRSLVALLVALALTLTGLATRAFGSPAEEAPTPVAGHVTIAPGETLWEVAVANAPAGTDPRAYLEQLRRLNGLDAAPIPAWTVVLLPATD